MTKVLFVCYRHGCGGEYLSHKISTHKLFKTLEIRTVNNRTIITNDFFNKQLLVETLIYKSQHNSKLVRNSK